MWKNDKIRSNASTVQRKNWILNEQEMELQVKLTEDM